MARRLVMVPPGRHCGGPYRRAVQSRVVSILLEAGVPLTGQPLSSRFPRLSHRCAWLVVTYHRCCRSCRADIQGPRSRPTVMYPRRYGEKRVASRRRDSSVRFAPLGRRRRSSSSHHQRYPFHHVRRTTRHRTRNQWPDPPSLVRAEGFQI